MAVTQFLKDGDPMNSVLYSGLGLQRISFDYSLTLDFDRGVGVRIGGQFRFAKDGWSTQMTPGEWRPQDGSLLQVWESEGCSLEADDHGALTVTFPRGTVITVRPDESYEAWELWGPGGVHVVCTPGGELARWQGSEN